MLYELILESRTETEKKTESWKENKKRVGAQRSLKKEEVKKNDD